MDILTVVLALLFAVILAHTLRIIGRKKLPPGPTPLPFVGSIHLLGKHPHKSLANLAKIYGPLMCIRLGFVNTVVVSSPEMAKQLLQKQDNVFSRRAVPNVLHAHDFFKHSVIFLPAEQLWRNLRKVLNSNVLSHSRLDANQHLRVKKVHELIAYCNQSCTKGAAVNIGRAAFRTSLNLLSNTVFSKDLTDPVSDSAIDFTDLVSDSALDFKELIWNIMVEAGTPNLADFFPFLATADPQRIRRRMTEYMGKVIDLLQGLIDDRMKQRRQSNSNSGDVVDALISISEKTPEEFDQIQIQRLCLDLFLAGIETTSATVEWAMAEALRNPEKMNKAKAELEQVIGKGKVVDEADIPRLPYLGSFVKETLRLHTPAPLLLPRRVTQDVEVCGYVLPKDSQIQINVWAMGRNPEIWENPLEFKPERFLETKIEMQGHDFELIPFGAGRRMCPGMPLATRMVPAMLGSLLNSFDWKLDGGMRPEEMDMEEKFGITLQKAQPLLALPVPLS